MIANNWKYGVLLPWIVLCASIAFATVPTTTTLSTSSSSVPANTPVILSATVTSSGTPLSVGQVVFCDASAVRCADSAILGSVWLTKSGTATLRTVLGPNATHNVKAVFVGMNTYASSTSSQQSIAVAAALPSSGPVSTMTAFTTTAVNQGTYNFTATVTTSGSPGPSGTVSFIDATNGNYLLASANLGTPTLAPGYIATYGPTLSGTTQGWNAVAVGDFNNDGILDYVGASSKSPYPISVMLGNGDGTFTSSSINHASTYGMNYSIAVADFDGDGNLDIVAPSENFYTNSILLGNGDGTFRVGPTIPMTYSSAVAVGDFNGDGIPDLAVVHNSGTCQVTILFGNGDATFSAGPSTSLPTYSVAVASFVAADLDGDGVTDLAIPIPNLQTSSYTFVVLKGNGDGSFTQKASYTTLNEDTAIVSGDFNGDGNPDLAVNNVNGSNNVTIWLGNGDGTFTQAPTPTVAGSKPFYLATGDFNADGKLDFAVSNYSSATVSIYYGNGDGTFTKDSTSPSTNGSPNQLAIGDFNGDGLPEIIVAPQTKTAATLLTAGMVAKATASVSNVNLYSAGVDSVVASYSGDSNYIASQSAGTSMYGKLYTPTVTLNASPSSPAIGGSLQLTAVIGPSSIGTYAPSGSISFYDNGTVIGTTSVSNAQATYTVVSLSSGSHALSAAYSGGGAFTGATSNTVDVTPQ